MTFSVLIPIYEKGYFLSFLSLGLEKWTINMGFIISFLVFRLISFTPCTLLIHGNFPCVASLSVHDFVEHKKLGWIISIVVIIQCKINVYP